MIYLNKLLGTQKLQNYVELRWNKVRENCQPNKDKGISRYNSSFSMFIWSVLGNMINICIGEL